MSSPIRAQYYVTGSIGKDDITAHVILDKNNNSIHVHFYGNIFGNTQKPILVKHSSAKFPEGAGIDLGPTNCQWRVVG